MGVLRRRSGAVPPGGPRRFGAVHQRRRLFVLRRRRGRTTAVAVPRRADRAEGDRKPASDFVVAGARRARGGRRHGLFRGQHLAVHGDVHLRPGRTHRAGSVAERGDGRSVPEAAAQRAVVRRRGAARPVDRVRRLGPGARRSVASSRLRPRDGRVAVLQFRRQGPRRFVRRRRRPASLCAYAGARHDVFEPAAGYRCEVPSQ